MPVQLLILAQMPRYAGLQAVHGAAEVEIVSGRKCESSQLAGSNLGWFIQPHRQDISALIHDVIVSY